MAWMRAIGPILTTTVLGLVSAEAQELRTEGSWQHVLSWLKGQRDRMSADLERVHAALLERTELEHPRLAARLTPAAPRPRARGYGMLPEIRPDKPFAAVKPRQRTYSLEALSERTAGDFRDASVLAGQVRTRADLELEPAVTEFERLRACMRNIEEHLAYHAWWQKAIPEQTEYFEGRNRLVARVRELLHLEASQDDARRVAELRRAVQGEVAPFRKTVGLALTISDDGSLRLPVVVATDITDETFLATFQNAVEAAFNASPAARARRFRVELSFVHVAPEDLYPDGPPEAGSAIDLEVHSARFPEGLVMTTGADSTHAWQGRCLLLGADPLTPRTLAHEFGHLLGFSDAYLRGHEPASDERYGLKIVEWQGLLDDLMGNPGAGIVTAEMIEQLVEAYD